jgi:hypothetical protein
MVQQTEVLMATREVTLRIDADRLVDLLDGYCGPRNIQDLYKCLEDPCKDGHMPIGWGGPVYCEVCSKFLYYEEASEFNKEALKRLNMYSPSLYIQQLGRIERRVGKVISFSNPARSPWHTAQWKPYNGAQAKFLGFDEACTADLGFMRQFEQLTSAGPFDFLKLGKDVPQLPKDWQKDELIRLITDRLVPVKDVDLWGTGWYEDIFTNTRKQP